MDLPFLRPKKLDVYSSGVVAFGVLARHAAYDGHLSVPDMTKVMKGGLKPSYSIEWSRLRRRYPAELIRCLERCWELDPSKRPSFWELCEVLHKSKSKMQLLVIPFPCLLLACSLTRFFVFYNLVALWI